MGSSVVGSTPCAMTILPCGAASTATGSTVKRATRAIRIQVMFDLLSERPGSRGPAVDGVTPEPDARPGSGTGWPDYLSVMSLGLDELVAPGLPADPLARAV